MHMIVSYSSICQLPDSPEEDGEAEDDGGEFVLVPGSRTRVIKFTKPGSPAIEEKTIRRGTLSYFVTVRKAIPTNPNTNSIMSLVRAHFTFTHESTFQP